MSKMIWHKPKDGFIKLGGKKIKINEQSLKYYPFKHSFDKHVTVHAIVEKDNKYYFARRIKVCKYFPFYKKWDIDAQSVEV